MVSVEVRFLVGIYSTRECAGARTLGAASALLLAPPRRLHRDPARPLAPPPAGHRLRPGLRPQARNPKPGSRNPKPGSRNLKPESRNLKPESRNPEPETRNLEPEARNTNPPGSTAMPRLTAKPPSPLHNPPYFSGRGTTRAEDAQGTPTQSHISPSTLVYEDNKPPRSSNTRGKCLHPGSKPCILMTVRMQSHMETLIIYKLGSMKFTTQNDL